MTFWWNLGIMSRFDYFFCIIGEAIVTPFIAWLCLLPLNFEWELKSRDFLRKCRPNICQTKMSFKAKEETNNFHRSSSFSSQFSVERGKLISFLPRDLVFSNLLFFSLPPWLSLSGCQVALEKCKYYVISLAEKRREKLRRSLQRFLSNAIFCFLFSPLLAEVAKATPHFSSVVS